MTPLHVAFQPNAYNDPVPAAAGGTFDSFVSVLRELVSAEHACANLNDRRAVDAAKASMPAIIPARLSAEKMQARLARGEKTARGSEVVEGSALVGLDIDKAPAAAVDAALARLRDGNVAAVVHGSPTDGVDPSVRKVRIYIATDRELAPAEIWPARVAWATALGLREWLDPQTSDPSRLFFAGRLAGTPERAFDVTGSVSVPVDPLLKAFPTPVSATSSANSSAPAGGNAPIIWSAGAEHEQRMTPAIVALLSPEYDRGGRHAKSRAIGAVLAQAGWTDDTIGELVRALPSDKPDFRADQAIDAAKLARAGERVHQSGTLGSAFGERIARHVVELAKQPVVVELEAQHVVNAATAQTASAPATYKIGNVEDPIPPVNWLCERLRIAPGAPTLFAGYGGLGKTMLVQLFVVCVVAGKPFLRVHPVRDGKALYLDYEQGPPETNSRFKRFAAELGLRGADLRGLDIASPPPFNLLSQNVEAALTDLCRHYDLVVIDSLRAATPGLDENSSEIRGPLDMLFRVSVATGCTFIVIHHARKTTKDNTDAGNQNMRGNSAINDASQAVVMLEAATHGGFSVKPGKVRIGKKFEPLDLAIKDTDIEGVPFQGLELVTVDSDAREEAERTDQEAADDTAVLRYLEAQAGGRFVGGYKALWLAMGGKPGRNRVEAAVGRLKRGRRIAEDRGAFLVTPGTPGVELAEGMPRVKL